MKQLILSLIISLLFGGVVLAEEEKTPSLNLKDGVLSCLDSNQTDKLNINDCLTFGQISIGDSRQIVQELLGNPDRIVTGVDTAQIGIFPLVPTKSGDDPYLLVTLKGDAVTTLTLQGRGTTQTYLFAGIKLGDKASAVIDRFGEPKKIVSHEGYGSELWSYGAYPFSFEIENNLVLSIQIWMVTEVK